MRREWEEAHRVTEELVEGPPSRRANATFTASPDGVSTMSLFCKAVWNLCRETGVRITYGRLEASSSVMMERR